MAKGKTAREWAVEYSVRADAEREAGGYDRADYLLRQADVWARIYQADAERGVIIRTEVKNGD